MNQLTSHSLAATVLPTAPHGQAGFDRPVGYGASNRYAPLAHGFFYALSVMVGVLGSRKARRLQNPLCQPDTSAAFSLTALVGGFKFFKLLFWSSL